MRELRRLVGLVGDGDADSNGDVDGSPVWHAVEEGPEGGITAAVVVELEVVFAKMDRSHLAQRQDNNDRLSWPSGRSGRKMNYLAAEEVSSGTVIPGVCLRDGVSRLHVRPWPPHPQAMALGRTWPV